jgi:hypothetical protein
VAQIDSDLAVSPDPGKGQKVPRNPFGFEFLLTFKDGRKVPVIRRSRRRNAEKVIIELTRARKDIADVAFVRSLDEPTFLAELEAHGGKKHIRRPVFNRFNPPSHHRNVVGPDSATGHVVAISEDVYILARRLAAIAGLDPTAPLNDLLRAVLSEAQKDLIKKYVTDDSDIRKRRGRPRKSD